MRRLAYFRRLVASIAAAMSSFAMAAPVTGDPVVNESIDYRDVDGDTQAALVSSLQRSAIVDDGGRPFYGRTNWQLAWNFDLYSDDASCRVSSATITLQITTSLPRWQPPARAPNELVARWNTFADALRTHETGHRTIAIDAAHEVAQRIDALPASSDCTAMKHAIKRTAETTLKEYRVKEKAYDTQTSHGRTQGAVFP